MKTSELSRTKTSEKNRSDPKGKPRNFMILCPTVAENSGVIEALYALYYLPQRFKLLLRTVGVKDEALFAKLRALISGESLRDRVTILGKQVGALQTAPPFAYADAVVYGRSDPMYTESSAQSIIVFDIASKRPAGGAHNFAVSQSTPEALASAILKVARNQR
jgi:hypothetical protein